MAVMLSVGSAVAAEPTGADSAWKSIAALGGFDTEKAQASMFNFPDSFPEGMLAVHPNSSQREAVTAILDNVQEDYLLGELSDESFDERIFIEPAADGKCIMLYTITGSGGTDTIAFIVTISEAQADEVASLWEERIKQEEEGKDEFDQDFSDE